MKPADYLHWIQKASKGYRLRILANSLEQPHRHYACQPFVVLRLA